VPIEIVVEHLVQAVIVGCIIIGVAYSPVFKAIGHRIMHGKAQVGGNEDPRVDDLLEDNAMMRRQIEEVQERVEFAERMLAQAQAREKLSGQS
jgi:hypothetical protein